MDTVTGQRLILASESDEPILNFVREHLAAIRKGELYCQLVGSDSIAVASI